MNSQYVITLMALLGKKTVLYKEAITLQKMLAVTEIAMSVPKQWAIRRQHKPL
ncbi:hypothetical protein [Hymenobacter wooponensis]|uniref:hypothetical protein n=1 Tax=Hymenobacter wooponensis TaxID=1525360 RepID=UPI001436AC37|nr:hypothetical protein [Hymenobacter wooponensis]